MDDSKSVSLRNRLASLEDECHRLLDRRWSVLLEPRAQVAPLQKLHHHVRRARLERSDVEHTGDVLTLHSNRGARLAQETADDLGVSEHFRQQELDRDPIGELK